MTGLEITLLYLLAAVLGVVACRMLKLPAMLGYLAVGVLIGPNALALAQSTQAVRYLGEFGVVFLMFVIGLEFNLPKLHAMRKHVFGLGLLQVAVTILGGTLAALGLAALAPEVWAMGWRAGGRWALFGAAATLTLVGIVFIWRSSVSWLAYFGGESQKLTAALLITAMFVATAVVLPKVLAGIRASRRAVAPASAQR
jgi:Kef-type K+ transport system membrane component KefB